MALLVWQCSFPYGSGEFIFSICIAYNLNVNVNTQTTWFLRVILAQGSVICELKRRKSDKKMIKPSK